MYILKTLKPKTVGSCESYLFVPMITRGFKLALKFPSHSGCIMHVSTRKAYSICRGHWDEIKIRIFHLSCLLPSIWQMRKPANIPEYKQFAIWINVLQPLPWLWVSTSVFIFAWCKIGYRGCKKLRHGKFHVQHFTFFCFMCSHVSKMGFHYSIPSDFQFKSDLNFLNLKKNIGFKTHWVRPVPICWRYSLETLKVSRTKKSW